MALSSKPETLESLLAAQWASSLYNELRNSDSITNDVTESFIRGEVEKFLNELYDAFLVGRSKQSKTRRWLTSVLRGSRAPSPSSHKETVNDGPYRLLAELPWVARVAEEDELPQVLSEIGHGATTGAIIRYFHDSEDKSETRLYVLELKVKDTCSRNTALNSINGYMFEGRAVKATQMQGLTDLVKAIERVEKSERPKQILGYGERKDSAKGKDREGSTAETLTDGIPCRSNSTLATTAPKSIEGRSKKKNPVKEFFALFRGKSCTPNTTDGNQVSNHDFKPVKRTSSPISPALGNQEKV